MRTIWSHLLQPRVPTVVCLESLPITAPTPAPAPQPPSLRAKFLQLRETSRPGSLPENKQLTTGLPPPARAALRPALRVSPPRPRSWASRSQRSFREIPSLTSELLGPGKNSSELPPCPSGLSLRHLSGRPCSCHLPNQRGSVLKLRLGANPSELESGHPVLCHRHGQHQHQDRPPHCLQAHLLWPATPPPAQPPPGCSLCPKPSLHSWVLKFKSRRPCHLLREATRDPLTRSRHTCPPRATPPLHLCFTSSAETTTI